MTLIKFSAVVFVSLLCLLGLPSLVQSDSGIRFVNYALNTSSQALGPLTLKSINRGETLFTNIAYGQGSPSQEYKAIINGTHDLRVYFGATEIASLVLNAIDKSTYTVFAVGIYAFSMGVPEQSPYIANITHTALLSGSALPDSVALPSVNITRVNYDMYMSIGHYIDVPGHARWLYISYWTNIPSGLYMNITSMNNTAIHIRGPISETPTGDPNDPLKSVASSTPIANILAPSNFSASSCPRSSRCVSVFMPDDRALTTPLSSERFYAEVAAYPFAGVTVDSMAMRGFITTSQAVRLVGDRRTLTSAGRAVIRVAHVAHELGPVAVHVNTVSLSPFITRIGRFSVFESSLVPGTYTFLITRGGGTDALNVTGAISRPLTVLTNGEFLITLFRDQSGSLNSTIYVGSQGGNSSSALQTSLLLVVLSSVIGLFFRL